jgi:hypothetical protein
LISDVLSPPVIWGVLAFPIAFREADSRDQALLWAFTYTIMVCILPAIYIGWMVWRGHISDIHLKERKERIRPFIVSLIGTGLAWAMRYRRGRWAPIRDCKFTAPKSPSPR